MINFKFYWFIILLLPKVVISQIDFVSDTIVNNGNYKIVERYENGQIKSITDSVCKTPYWIFFNKDGSFKEAGMYKRNKKQGIWWISNTRFLIYRKGRIKARGIGCWGCPDFY